MMGRKRAYALLDISVNCRKLGQFLRDPNDTSASAYDVNWLE
jgi:hypothetical protein